jgi:hypothetical protein
MTPKEKAIDLWWKYYSRIEHTLSEEYSPHEKDITKHLAVIAVDEILSLNWQTQEDAYYWYAVKQEIEEL